MARFQKTERRPDETPRRMFTQADAEFLAGLQHELNTQDTMGNRDPRFWIIRQSRQVPCGKDEADGVAIIQDSACETVATDMDGFVRHLADRYEKWNFKAEPKAAGTWSVSVASMAGEEFSDDWVSSPEDMIELLESAGIRDYEAAYSRTEAEDVPNTLFLTHAACEDHLRKYHYNYEPDAHAYAMTAVRSPEFERLVAILQTVRWDQVPVFREDGLGGAGWTGREAVIEKADLVPSEGQLDFRLVLKGKGWACEYDTGFPCGARVPARPPP